LRRDLPALVRQRLGVGQLVEQPLLVAHNRAKGRCCFEARAITVEAEPLAVGYPPVRRSRGAEVRVALPNRDGEVLKGRTRKVRLVQRGCDEAWLRRDIVGTFIPHFDKNASSFASTLRALMNVTGMRRPSLGFRTNQMARTRDGVLSQVDAAG